MGFPLQVEGAGVTQLALQIQWNVVEELPQNTVAEAIVVQVHLQQPASQSRMATPNKSALLCNLGCSSTKTWEEVVTERRNKAVLKIYMHTTAAAWVVAYA